MRVETTENGETEILSVSRKLTRDGSHERLIA